MLRWAVVPALAFVLTFGGSLAYFALDDDGRSAGGAATTRTGELVVTYTPAVDDADHAQLGSLRLDGSDLRNVVQGGSIGSPSVAPDGRSAAFQHADANGGVPRPLTPAGNVKETRPSWSPDGTRLAFTRDPGKILTWTPPAPT